MNKGFYIGESPINDPFSSKPCLMTPEGNPFTHLHPAPRCPLNLQGNAEQCHKTCLGCLENSPKWLIGGQQQPSLRAFSRSKDHRNWENHRKTIGKWWFNGGLMGFTLWLVVWNMNCMFRDIGNNRPN